MKSNYFLILITCLTFSCTNRNIPTNNQKETLNNLKFSKIDVSKNKATPKDYLKDFTLNKDEFLNIHFTLEKPLIQSIKLLAPNLSENELLQNGSFQFSFLVDGETLYIENLNTGAGLNELKTNQLNHKIRLVAPQKLDFWGWFMWLKFIKLGGGQDALSEGNHSLSIEVRPYIKQDTLKVGILLAKGTINIEVPKIQIDKNLIPLQKIQPNSGWEISKDNFDLNKIEDLNKKIAEGRFESINGIVVIKEDKLLIEEYINGENRNSLHDPRSVGKSIASTMLGIAIEENFIKNENALLKDFYDLKSFENYSVKKIQ